MPGLRLLLRVAPFFVGALAVVVWLRRRHAERVALPPPRPVAALPAAPAPEPVAESAPESVAEPSLRFARDPEPEPISIVTVVDDLLEIGRR